jgi:hypothetical protein
MINEDHGAPYMMIRTNENHLLIALLALRVSNPSCELDEALVGAHTTYKRNKAIHIHIFGILVSK